MFAHPWHVCAFSRWNMMSCCSGANRPQTSSATNPSRRPAAPLQPIILAAASPAQLRSLIWQWSWKTASSQSTKLYLTRSSPASRKPKWTSTRTDVQSRTMIGRDLSSDRCSPSWDLQPLFLPEEEQGCFGINISRGSVFHTLQASFLLSYWHIHAFVCQHCSFNSVLKDKEFIPKFKDKYKHTEITMV